MTKRKRYEDDDDDNVLRTLKDGERMHFSMMAMDSDVPRCVGADHTVEQPPLDRCRCIRQFRSCAEQAGLALSNGR